MSFAMRIEKVIKALCTTTLFWHDYEFGSTRPKMQRMRFYLLDRVTALVPGKNIEGLKAWTLSEEYFEQHFPLFPVVPGVLQIESMAQLMGVFFERTLAKEFPLADGLHRASILSIVHKAKFKDFVRPGDQVRLEGVPTAYDRMSGTAQVKCFVGDRLVAEAELQFRFLETSNDKRRMASWAEHAERYHSVILGDLG
jgi:3-hydroxyacyl-[acyl-carrier-protein] dehydratase